MEDIQIDELCTCCKHKRNNCKNIKSKKQGNCTIYKCLNYEFATEETHQENKKDWWEKMDRYDYIKYTFYDECNSYIAIVDKNIPKEYLELLQEEYDEVKFKE